MERKQFKIETGPRKVKPVLQALQALVRAEHEHIELTGTVGGVEHSTVLWSPFGGGPGNVKARELYEAIGERFAWTITDTNRHALEQAAREALPLAQAGRPTIDRRQSADEAQRREAEAQARDAERLKREAEADASVGAILAKRPPGAAALIVAELEQDDSDIMTDYFATSIKRCVAIGWRTGRREDFRQLRRAAASFPDTAHLGPDAPADVEHRDNYSMGAGNYLKASGRYSTGWRVVSRDVGKDGRLGWHGSVPLEDALPSAEAPDPSRTCSSTGFLARPAPAGVGGATVLEASNKRGPFFLVVLADRLEHDAFEALRASAKAAGGWYSRKWGRQPGGFGFSTRAEAEDWARGLDGGTRDQDTPQVAPTDCPDGLEPGTSRPEDIVADVKAEKQKRADVLELFEPRAELTFADLLLALRELEGARVHKLEGQDTALVMLPGARTAKVWDNGGEVGVEIVDGGSLPDMFPLRTSAGLIDPWEVVLAVQDSIEHAAPNACGLEARQPGRGGDAPFPVPNVGTCAELPTTDCPDGLEPPDGEPCIDCDGTRTQAGTCLDCFERDEAEADARRIKR